MSSLPIIILGRRVSSQTSLPNKGSKQSIDIILQQQIHIEIHRRLERSIQQCHLLQVEMLGIDFLLRLH